MDTHFPLNPFVSAARLTKLAAAPSALRVAAPNFNESSQKTTRMPRGAVENGTKPTLTASDIGKSSKKQGLSLAGNPPGGTRNVLFGCDLRPSRAWSGHYGLPLPALPSAGSGCKATSVSYTHLRAHETRHDLVCRLLLEK